SLIVHLAHDILMEAIAAGASDIHLEPYSDRDMVVRLRVDGECVIQRRVEARYRRAIVSRLKIMAGLDISERRRPQDGKLRVKDGERVVELRMATLPTA